MLKAMTLKESNQAASQYLGLLYEYQGDYPAAVEYFQKGLVGTSKDYLGIAVNLGRLLNMSKRYRETIAVLESRLSPNSPIVEAHAILATAHLAIRNYKAAQVGFERVLELKPESREAQLGLARAMRGAGYNSKALETFKFLTASHPEWLPAHLELGETLLVMDRPVEARKAFDAAIELGGNPVAIQNRIAAYHLEKKEYTAAQQIYQQLVDAGQADPDAYVRLSELLRANGKLADGIKILQDGLKLYPESGYLHLRLGSELAALRRYQEALPLLERAFSLWPNDPRVLRTYSLVLGKIGDTDNAAKIAAKLHALQPESSNEAILYAMQLEANNQAQEAEAVYRSVIKTDPDNALALNNLASLLSKKRAWTEAEQYAKQANDLVKGNAHLLDTLGWVYYQQARLEEAVTVLEQASQAAPNIAVIQFHKGMALDKLGETIAARKALSQAIELDPDADWVPIAKHHL